MTSTPSHQRRVVIWGTLIPLIVGICLCGIFTTKIYDIREKYVLETISEFGQLPSPSLQAASLEFKGIIADYLLFRTITYMGMKLLDKQNLTFDEMQLVYQILQKVTDLDPRFLDPYIFAEMTLAWQSGMFEEANALLMKATLNRPEDYRSHYYIGFNHFYFKKDPVKAAPYFRAAAMAPNAPAYIKGLAARVSLYSRQTAIGISFLEDLIKETQDTKLIAYLQKRLLALKAIDYLEQWVLEFKKRNGAFPNRLNELISSGLIPSIPMDPYGGEFILLENGRVYTTSELIGPEKHQQSRKSKLWLQ